MTDRRLYFAVFVIFQASAYSDYTSSIRSCQWAKVTLSTFTRQAFEIDQHDSQSEGKWHATHNCRAEGAVRKHALKLILIRVTTTQKLVCINYRNPNYWLEKKCMGKQDLNPLTRRLDFEQKHKFWRYSEVWRWTYKWAELTFYKREKKTESDLHVMNFDQNARKTQAIM